MRYRKGDNVPSVSWIYNDNLFGATVVATFTKPDYTISESQCTLTFETVNDKIQTRITHHWSETDLDTIGLGKVQLRYTDAEGNTGSIPPVNGFQVKIDP